MQEVDESPFDDVHPDILRGLTSTDLEQQFVQAFSTSDPNGQGLVSRQVSALLHHMQVVWHKAVRQKYASICQTDVMVISKHHYCSSRLQMNTAASWVNASNFPCAPGWSPSSVTKLRLYSTAYAHCI